MTDQITDVQLLLEGTPLEEHLSGAGLLVKREDLSCPPPGPPFSKMRGVLSHVLARYNEGVRTFGVLDTRHSQAGHAVALACKVLDARCINFFPVYKDDARAPTSGEGIPAAWAGLDRTDFIKLRDPQVQSNRLGAELRALPAGRSAILFHQAKKLTVAAGGYMMPNALKLPETVGETAAEVRRTVERADRTQYKLLRDLPWLVSASSGTITAGVVKGLSQMFERPPLVIAHLGYSRSEAQLRQYIIEKSGTVGFRVAVVDEGYAYADQARPGPTPPWPCNPYYDLKAFRWWVAKGREEYAGGGHGVLWNIG